MSSSGKKVPELTGKDFIKQGVVDLEMIRLKTSQFDVANDARVKEVREKAVQLQLSIQFNCGPQVPGVRVSFPFNPTDETNVLKSATNIHSDGSLGFGGSFLLTLPGVRSYDVVGFNVSSASARYTNLPSKSLDAVTEQGIYQIYLGAYHPDFMPIDEKRGQIASLLTIDTLGLGFVNQTAYLPGYRAETADLFTPQFTLARQNVDLDPDWDKACYTPKVNAEKPGDDLKRAGFCYYLGSGADCGADIFGRYNAAKRQRCSFGDAGLAS